MQINVVNIIIDSLLAKGSCTIDSLGTFTLEKKSAAFIKGKTELEAPTASILFSEKNNGDNPLYKSLLEVYPFSETKSKKVVSIFANKIINGLLNFDQVNLTNLGTLTKKDSQIIFAASPQIDRILNKSLPTINLTPFLDAKKNVQKEKEQEGVEQVAETPVPPVVKKDVIEPIKVAPAVEPSSTPIEAVVETKPTSSPLVVKPAKNATIASAAVADKITYPAYEDEKESFLSRFLPWILLLGFLLAVGWGVMKFISLAKQSNNPTTQEVGRGDMNNVEGETATIVDSTDITSEPKSDETAKVEAAKPLPATDADGVNIVRPKECIIITGSFMMNENIDGMANKIRSLGYEVYTEKYGYYIRVGFAFPCDDEDLNLKLFIEEIRAKLSKSAWYLVPDIEI